MDASVKEGYRCFAVFLPFILSLLFFSNASANCVIPQNALDCMANCETRDGDYYCPGSCGAQITVWCEQQAQRYTGAAAVEEVLVQGYRSNSSFSFNNPQLISSLSNQDLGAALPAVPEIKAGSPSSKDPNAQQDMDCETPKESTDQPVHIASGTKFLDEYDLSLGGEFPLHVLRSYSSRAIKVGTGSWGTNWYSAWDRNLSFKFISDGKICAASIGDVAAECSRTMNAQTLEKVFYAQGDAMYGFAWNSQSGKWLTDHSDTDRMQLL